MMNTAAFHASARFGLGAKKAELQQIGSDPRGWLLEQLKHPAVPQEVTKRYGGDGVMGETLGSLRRRKQGLSQEALQEKAMQARDIYINETGARVLAQVHSAQPFIERLVMFWSNHFTVSVQKTLIGGIVNQYEVEAIRPYVTGYFRDMLLAVCRHPAMLFYLDNIQSFGANSMIGKRRGKGVNENLAREILELHTLGVGTGYTQQDVIALAKILTGWTLDRGVDGPIIAYRYTQAVHEPGDKWLLGHRFTENGEQEGIDALTMLATHPATARHIATKLARHFIADDPPAAAINALSQSFLKSGGHLPTVVQTLIGLQESWSQPLGKVKTPYEYVVSAFRLTGVEPSAKQAIVSLEALNYRAFNAPSPAGYDDVASAWASPDAIMKRIEWGHKLAQILPAGTDPLQLAQIGLGEAMGASTRQAIMRAASATDGIGLLLASPEFQRR